MKLNIKELQEIETQMLKQVHEICERHNITYYLAYGSVLGAVRHGGPIPWDYDVDILVPYSEKDKFISMTREELSAKFTVDYYDNNKIHTALFPRIGLKGYSTRNLHIDVFWLVGSPSNPKEQYHHKKTLEKLQKIHFYKNASLRDFPQKGWKRKLKIALKKLSYLFKSNKLIRDNFFSLCEQFPYKDAEYVVNASGGYGQKEIIPKIIYGKGKLMNYEEIEVKVPEKYVQYLKHFYGDYQKFPNEEARKIPAFFKIIKLKKSQL